MNDPVEHPAHYTHLPIECWDVTQWFMSNPASALKYIWRAGKKGSAIEDYQKAIAYLQHEIDRLGGEPEQTPLAEARERVAYLRAQCSAAQGRVTKLTAWAYMWKRAAKKAKK